MTEELIIQMFKSNGNPFKKLTIKELNYVADFLKKKLQSKNGTWTQKNLKKFYKEYDIYNSSIVFDLRLFFTEYERRQRKKLRALDKLLISIKSQSETNYRRWWEKQAGSSLKLKDKTEIGSFLIEFMELKIRYIKGNNDTFIKMIADNIETGYKKNTLRSLYYYSLKNK